MGSRSAEALLRLPVTLHGIRLGHPVDVLVDAVGRRVLGVVVICGDESHRFLPFAAAQPGDEEIRVASALLLLEDVDFYRGRADSLRELLGGVVRSHGEEVGVLDDLLLRDDGSVVEVVVRSGATQQRLPAAGTSLSAERAAA